MPRLHLADLEDDDVLDRLTYPTPVPRRPVRQETASRFRPRQRRNERETFKCGRCRVFVDPPAVGSRYRNHCPVCLTSRHVDAKRPGDRASPCRALMAPVGTYFRPDGEQMIVHRCHGCDVERANRIAADDNPVALRHLTPVQPRRSEQPAAADEAIA